MHNPKLTYPWLLRLRSFSSKIRERALSWDASTVLVPPLIKLQPTKKGDYTSKCRAISEYSLEDGILCSCFAAYLRDSIDDGLDPHSFAFRPARVAGGTPPDYHDAIRTLRNYRSTFALKRTLWVSECDIQGFYDAVSHDVVRTEMDSFLAKHRITVDPRLMYFLESTLRSYSYNCFARPKAVNELRAKGVKKPKLADPIELLRRRHITPSTYHGIPQGSAFSCVLANLILSRADEAVRHTVESGWPGRKGIYLRYCDDIVIVDPIQSRCARAIRRYETVLDELKLPYHPSKPFIKYSRMFWKNKSKSPYMWANTGKSTACSHWLSFVGYQIHRDGTTRIRKSSVDNEISKQRETVNETIRMLADRIRLHGIPRIHSSVSYRTMMHLIAIAVGHPKSGKIAPAANGVGWAKGFVALREDRIDPTGLKRLDKSRTLELQRQKQHIRCLTHQGRVTPVTPPHPPKKIEVRFAGRPFSYFRQYEEFVDKQPTPRPWHQILSGIDSVVIACESFAISARRRFQNKDS